jgi:DNA-binding MarR family transcriptional regulator
MSELHKNIRWETEKGRSLLQASYRAALGEDGQRIGAAQAELDSVYENLRPKVTGALAAGLRVAEVADLLGISRQKIYEFRGHERDSETELQIEALSHLGAAGASTPDQLAALLGVTADEALSALRALEKDGAVRTAMSGYGADLATYYKLTESGAARVERWVLGTDREPRRMTIYAEIGIDEREALREVAIDMFGPEFHAIIEPGTVNSQTSPELAFSVPADTPEIAIAKGRERLEELRRLAGVAPRIPQITAIATAGPLHLLFGAGRTQLLEVDNA